MSADQLIARRSIRSFVADYKIPKEDLEKIIKAAENSPSAFNHQEIDLLVITNKELLQKVNDVCLNSLNDHFKNHVCAEIKEKNKVSQAILYDASALILLYANKERAKGYEKKNSGFVGMSIIAAAASLGLGTVPIGLLCSTAVEDLFKLEHGSIQMGVAIGKQKTHDVDPKENLRKVTYFE